MADTPEQAARREALIKELGIEQTAFTRQLGNARVPFGTKPAANTHTLSWLGGKPHDKKLYSQDVVDLLVGYILKLEAQLAIEATEFRAKSIRDLVQTTELRGFGVAE
jgi:hypothetical protein